MTRHEKDDRPGGYAEPATMQEALARKADLAGRIEAIQAQLANRDRMVDGRRLDAREYQEWRCRAVHARGWAAAELRLVKAWIAATNARAKELARPAADGQPAGAPSARGAAVRSVEALASHAEALERRVAELEAENARLRKGAA
jgi:DNA repair exonuclease SbcCD ATPase subunit